MANGYRWTGGGKGTGGGKAGKVGKGLGKREPQRRTVEPGTPPGKREPVGRKPATEPRAHILPEPPPPGSRKRKAGR